MTIAEALKQKRGQKQSWVALKGEPKIAHVAHGRASKQFKGGGGNNRTRNMSCGLWAKK